MCQCSQDNTNSPTSWLLGSTKSNQEAGSEKSLSDTGESSPGVDFDFRVYTRNDPSEDLRGESAHSGFFTASPKKLKKSGSLTVVRLGARHLDSCI